MSSLLKDARILANYVNSLNYSEFEYSPTIPYNHIGALYTDIILQAGLNYNTVVRPRVAKVYNLFPEANTVSGFLDVINKFGLKYVISWRDEKKADRILSLINFSITNDIETENDFKKFLLAEGNRLKVLDLSGIGPKTIDYALKLLCVDTVAVDRHIFTFVSNAGIKRNEYTEVKKVVEFAADLLDSSRIKLDNFIWKNMSRNLSKQITLSL
ncbi:hypothetical protein [Lacibacter sp. H407]|uniref:hypothetical protein n=1 Tax=Lacibacter sp. H407 TaxID=3133423 RepID=UPI0030C0DC96